MDINTIETHPFKAFVPPRIRVLIVGSFPGREQTGSQVKETDWFYGAPRNQFWKILELVFQKQLKTRVEKQALFEEAGIGITDMISACVRTQGTNLDENLEVKEYNKQAIEEILEQYQPKVLFTSRFVEKLFRKLFPAYSNTDILPSPSPRYFRLSINDKAKIYQDKLLAVES